MATQCIWGVAATQCVALQHPILAHAGTQRLCRGGTPSGSELRSCDVPDLVSLEVFRKLPKTDLHVHLDGSLRLSTLIALAEDQSVVLPASDPEGLKAAMKLGQNTGSLVDYLKAFDTTLKVMQVEDGLYRVAYELAQDAAAENVQ